ncbi:transposase-like protein [Klebsiella grimontii]|uniref:Transposase-like protein n=1 Tax=Klebsiella grimontii TaxID=2058152 RepID=A0A7H4P613_9ENTR|nr:transposase-like protein [Klebsiella grimontii]
MSNYRRSVIPGGTWFFTVNLQNRQSDLLIRHIERLRAATIFTKRKKPFLIQAWVILPEHMHCIWTLPEGDSDYSGRWRDIKKNVLPRFGDTPGLAAAFLGTCDP